MKKTYFLAAVLSLMLAVWGGAAHAQFAKPEQAVKYRQAAMQMISSHFGRMSPVVKGQAPYDKAAIQANVAILTTLSSLPWQGFIAGTDSKYAQADIWSDPAGFKAAQDKFTNAVAKLSAAADTGNLDTIKTAFGDVGASCKSCHDVFHEKK